MMENGGRKRELHPPITDRLSLPPSLPSRTRERRESDPSGFVGAP